MSSKYTKTKGIKLLISASPTDVIPSNTTGMIELTCTVNDMSMSSPAGDEIDVSTLCSATKETISGLPGEATVSQNVNFKIGDTGQDKLRSSYKTGDNYAFVMELEDGSKVSWVARVTNYDFNVPKNGILTGSFSYKVKDDFTFIAPAVGGNGEDDE